MTRYKDFLIRGRNKWGDEFSDRRLNQAFVTAYNSGNRVEVDFNGEVKRGRVGMTTGWKPAFLLMLRRDSTGSSWVIHEDDKILRVIPERKNKI